jgi:aminopeptidase YwaD
MKMFTRLVIAMAGACAALAGAAKAQKPPLLPEKDAAALANELSGETAKRNLEGIARFHRQRGSRGFHEAAELVAERLRAYGLSDVAILQFPADGKIFYGTQRSRPAWDAEVGELTEITLESSSRLCQEGWREEVDKLHAEGKIGVAMVCLKVSLLASYEAEPIVLAEDSESAEVTAELVDVGQGTKETDYAGKDVKGKIVLVSAQPGAVQDLAVGKLGAVGIVSYAQNQKTAWWGEDENLIRWGHLETFSANKTFAFMVSLKTARGLRERLAKREKIRLHAVVKAGQHAGNYEVVTATIPGADPKLKEEEIAFSCHLDHQGPGANDNASGCATILEVARTLQKLINEGKLGRPTRTIRFIFPPEIEGTMAFLTGTAVEQKQPKVAGKEGEEHTATFWLTGHVAPRIKAVIHMDMVGGGPETKAVFHVTRGPMSLPSFVHDVAWAFAEWVNEESYKFAATGKAEYPMVAPEGGKEPLRAEYSAFTMGSDHDVYQDSSFGIPAIYLNDWPDQYIHTNFDTAANIDPTKLKRAAFIGAASGYFLANRSPAIAVDLWNLTTREITQRHTAQDRRDEQLATNEGLAASASFCIQANKLFDQVRAMVDEELAPMHRRFEPEIPKCWTGYPSLAPLELKILDTTDPRRAEAIRTTFRRSNDPKGPLAVFGYDYFTEHAKAAGLATPKLLSYEGLWGGGEEYAYEVLNFADGKRNAQEIRDSVSAEYGPVTLEMVVEYLKALEKIGVVEQVK